MDISGRANSLIILENGLILGSQTVKAVNVYGARFVILLDRCVAQM